MKKGIKFRDSPALNFINFFQKETKACELSGLVIKTKFLDNGFPRI